MEKFKEGSLVCMKSGGPLMTVEIITPDQVIHAVWFADLEISQGLFCR